ncbi:hypothetical protein J3E74DRAFT_281121 [Bipolaris maydis]|nr:hypothetical protein J3E74DRAFT_281121 [Bipolaris maydis]
MAPNHDIATRALVVTLKSVAGKSNSEVCYLTGLPESTVRSIYAKAIKRGFEYNASQPVTICNAHLEDAPRSGRPTKETEASRGSQYLCYNSAPDTQEGRLQEDEADEEAWVDQED